MIEPCATDTEPMNRVAPAAVCRQLITNLDRHKRLNPQEQATVLLALKNTGIEVDRVLADLSRQTAQSLLKEF